MKSNERVLIVSHHGSIEGALDYLASYLIAKNFNVVLLSHPLHFSKTNYTKLVRNGILVKNFSRINLSIVNLILDFLWSSYFVIRHPSNHVVGANNFDTLAAIVGSKICFWRKSKIYYFASDYSENRFNNRILDSFYMLVEKFSNKYSDRVISNTYRAEKERLSHGLTSDRSLVVPNGVHIDRPGFQLKNISKNNFIYVGAVNKEHGILDAIMILKKNIFKLVVIGQGDGWGELRRYCDDQKINADFYYKKSHDFVIQYLQGFNGYGLAPYRLDQKYIYYASSLKISEYIACGVPVITSDATELAGYVSQNGLGIVYPMENLKKLTSLLYDYDDNGYNAKAKRFYSLFNHSNLYRNVLID